MELLEVLKIFGCPLTWTLQPNTDVWVAFIPKAKIEANGSSPERAALAEGRTFQEAAINLAKLLSKKTITIEHPKGTHTPNFRTGNITFTSLDLDMLKPELAKEYRFILHIPEMSFMLASEDVNVLKERAEKKLGGPIMWRVVKTGEGKMRHLESQHFIGGKAWIKRISV